MANLPYPAAKFVKKIADVAYAKERNVGKVLAICKKACQNVVNAARDNEISIHKAYEFRAC